ncbi:MAG: hypothetical protein DWI28_05040 [Planctomycetota bacterium]|nr:MAG: hypothetical protein DWI28_05040 [Planctomycetota bacterium]
MANPPNDFAHLVMIHLLSQPALGYTLQKGKPLFLRQPLQTGDPTQCKSAELSLCLKKSLPTDL